MSTIKKTAQWKLIKGKRYLVDEDGEKYNFVDLLPQDQMPKIGDKMFMGKQLNIPQAEMWEIWPITVEAHPTYNTFPKTWYGHQRYLLYKVA